MNWFHLGLAALMLVTGSINTISVKWADLLTSPSTDGKPRGFRHPFLQACGMFLGEMLCMVAFYLVKCYREKKRQRELSYLRLESNQTQMNENTVEQETPFNPLIFLPPALCDMTATSIQYIGLTLTYASSFQMLRGAVIIFTGILSTIVFRRRLEWFRWTGMIFVIGGLVTVGTTDILYPDHHNKTNIQPSPEFKVSSQANGFYYGNLMLGSLGVGSDEHTPAQLLLGDIMIVCAQVIVASQMVYEEKFITKYNVPALKAVGWEGTFGFLTLSSLLIPFYFIPVGNFFGDANPRHVLEDVYDGLFQLAHNPELAGAFSLTIFSIAFFNFAGISVTKEMSATTRMVLDSVRTLVIWGVSLGLGWQTFHLLQLAGFVILVMGMCIYNDLLIAPCLREVAYRSGIVDRPGSFYAMQNDIEEELETSSDDAQTTESTSVRSPETTVFDPRHENQALQTTNSREA